MGVRGVALRTVVLVLAAFLALVACTFGQSTPAPKSSSSAKKTLHVLGTWTGDDQNSFLATIKPFEERTGVTISYEGTRDVDAILTARARAGSPPDLVGIPSPAVMAQHVKTGDLKALDSVLDMSAMRSQYGQAWLDLATVDDKLYGVSVRSSLQGQIWYDPKTARSYGLTAENSPRTWDQMISLSNSIRGSGRTPWCIGLQTRGPAGWPGTDWIGDIVLRQSGLQKYQDWYNGRLKWTSPELKRAWQAWGTIAADPKMAYGGRVAVNATSFEVAGNPLFSNPPGCYLHHQSSFITTFFQQANPNLKPVEDFNFFPFPDINPDYAGAEEVTGELFGMVKDSPAARDLLRYMATSQAQAIWVQRGGALSANREVAPSAYPDAVSRQAAQVLTGARITQFAASQHMPEKMTQAFFEAVRAYVKDPSSLDAQLTNLDKVQDEAYR